MEVVMSITDSVRDGRFAPVTAKGREGVRAMG